MSVQFWYCVEAVVYIVKLLYHVVRLSAITFRFVWRHTNLFLFYFNFKNQAKNVENIFFTSGDYNCHFRTKGIDIERAT